MTCETMTAPFMNGDSHYTREDTSSSFASSSTRHSRSRSTDSIPGVVLVHPPTPDGKVPDAPASIRTTHTARSSSTSSYSSRAEDTMQNVRPPRRKRLSPSASPSDSPVGSRTSSPIVQAQSLPSSLKNKPTRFEESSPSSSASVTPTSANSPSGSTLPTVPVPASPSSPSSSHYFPPKRVSSAQTTRPSVNPVANSFNHRRQAAGRPTLISMSTETASAALKLNLENLGRPRFDPTSQTFVTDSDAPHTMSGRISSSPLIRKKSGELVKSSLKVSMTPTYDSNPLSASSNASTEFSSPYAGSKSLPTTPSCPKYVHFDTRLERVRLFLSEQKPAAVSRSGSPSDENGGIGGSGSEGGEFPFPSTSDEEEITRRSLELRLPNFPLQQPFDSDLYIVSLALTEDAKSLRGVIHVRNIAFNKRVCVRFTFDTWSTTSEVTATFQDSIKGGTFDRFSFIIKLQDLMARIEEKTLFLAVRYNVDGREIWDSNAGQNYQVEFKKNKAMKASQIREARKAARAPGAGAGGKKSEWSDKGGNGGPSADRMADLKLQLSRLADDDYDEDGLAAPKALLSPGLTPSSPLAARYDFGASLKNTTKASTSSRNYGTGWDGSPPSVERRLSELSSDGSNANASPMIGQGPYSPHGFGSTPTPAEGGAMGLRFDPSLSFGSPASAMKPLPRLDGPPLSSISAFDRTSATSFGSLRETDSFALASRAIPIQPDSSEQNTPRSLTFGQGMLSPPAMSSSLSSTSSMSSISSNSSQASSHSSTSRHHSRSAYGTQSLDYFSAAAVRRTPPASPRVEGLGALPDGTTPLGSRFVSGARFNSYPLARGQGSPYQENPPTLSRNMFGPSSINPSGDLGSPASQSSTPSMTASSGGTPLESPISLASPPPFGGHDPSLSLPRQGSLNLGSVSYSDFVNQYCFFTGGSSAPSEISTSGLSHLSPGIVDDNFRSPPALSTIHPSISSSSVDSFFSAGPSSGFTTPTNVRSPAAITTSSPAAGGYFGVKRVEDGMMNKGGSIRHIDVGYGTDHPRVSDNEGSEGEGTTPKAGRSPAATEVMA